MDRWTAVRVLIGLVLAWGVVMEAGWVTAVFLLLIWFRMEMLTVTWGKMAVTSAPEKFAREVMFADGGK